MPLLDYLGVDKNEILLKAAPFGYDHGHAARAGGYWLSVEFECHGWITSRECKYCRVWARNDEGPI